jgi:hypothetical protein
MIEGPASVEREVPLDILPVYVLAEQAGALQRELGLH